jgi:hypothetical protein
MGGHASLGSQALPSLASVPTLGIRQCVPEDSEWAIDWAVGQRPIRTHQTRPAPSPPVLRSATPPGSARQLRNPGMVNSSSPILITGSVPFYRVTRSKVPGAD